MGSGASTQSRSPEIQKIMMGRLASTLVPGSVVYPMNELFNHINIYQNCMDGDIIIMFDEVLEQNHRRVQDCTRWNELFLATQGLQYFEECDISLTPSSTCKGTKEILVSEIEKLPEPEDASGQLMMHEQSIALHCSAQA